MFLYGHKLLFLDELKNGIFIYVNIQVMVIVGTNTLFLYLKNLIRQDYLKFNKASKTLE